MRGDGNNGIRERIEGKFQFTPLREGRRNTAQIFTTPTKFQFTPLREGRPYDRGIFYGGVEFQFTPLREGRRKRRYYTIFPTSVSIHAPA